MKVHLSHIHGENEEIQRWSDGRLSWVTNSKSMKIASPQAPELQHIHMHRSIHLLWNPSLYPRDPITFQKWWWNLNTFLRRWLYTPFIIWQGDCIPRASCRVCWKRSPCFFHKKGSNREFPIISNRAPHQSIENLLAIREAYLAHKVWQPLSLNNKTTPQHEFLRISMFFI